jgi:hypothetical protein
VAWSCVVVFDAKDCITDHWADPLNGWSEPAGIRAPCPVRQHRNDRGPLSIQVKGGRPVWFCHCGCPDELTGRAIADRVPCYTWSPRRPKRGPDLELARELLLDKSVPPNALRVGTLLALGMEMKEITRALEIPRSTYYDAVRILGQRPRSR